MSELDVYEREERAWRQAQVAESRFSAAKAAYLSAAGDLLNACGEQEKAALKWRRSGVHYGRAMDGKGTLSDE